MLLESKAKVYTVFVEVDGTAVDVDHHSDDCASLKVAEARASFVLEVVVLSPLMVCVFVSSVDVHAPHILLLGQILVHHEVFTRDSETHFWVDHSRTKRLNSELEVVFVLLETQGDPTYFGDLAVFVLLLDHALILSINTRPGHYPTLGIGFAFKYCAIGVDADVLHIILIVYLKVESFGSDGFRQSLSTLMSVFHHGVQLVLV